MLLRVVYYGDEEDKIWDRELLLYLFVTCQALVSFHFFFSFRGFLVAVVVVWSQVKPREEPYFRGKRDMKSRRARYTYSFL